MKYFWVFFLLCGCATTQSEKDMPSLTPEFSLNTQYLEEPSVETPTEVVKETKSKKNKKTKVVKEEVKKEEKVLALPSYPFSSGEVLKFKAFFRSWEVGEAVLSVKKTPEGYFNFNFKVETTGMIRKFYRLRVKQESITDAYLRPLKFLAYSDENGREKTTEDHYDTKNKKVTTKQNGSTTILDFPTTTFNDTLTSLYRLRAQGEGSGQALVDGKFTSFQIRFLSKEGDLDKYAVEIEEKPPQFLWLDQSKKIKRIELETKSGLVILTEK